MEELKHECGVAMVRLLKPLEYYQDKYGSWQYGLNKLYLLMEKQHNRGQEGAGIGCINSRMAPGNDFIFRGRALGASAIKELFEDIYSGNIPKEKFNDPEWAAANLPFAGESLMGHLRYSTTGRRGMSYVHPFLRRSSWKSKNLLLCGNFNLTNVNELFSNFIKEGQHPRIMADTFLMLETLGAAIDRNVQKIYDSHENVSVTGSEMCGIISDSIDLPKILSTSSEGWDGGYVICGLLGDNNSFAFRDPWGIRSAYYYHDEEIAVLASERPVIQTAFNVDTGDVKELLPGQALIIDHRGKISLTLVHQPKTLRPCSFERIYFSRGSDADIYKERKTLGRQLVAPILKSINNDLENTVFSFIPNTAEVAFFGMMEGFEEHLAGQKKEKIAAGEDLDKVLAMRVRQEKVAVKDIKLRTFIAEDKGRDDLAAHVYDITYGSIRPRRDNLVVIDDSIVRGTTLRQSIIKILDRLNPKKIVIVSSSPQVRYPDCYGIDMSSMNEFIAFRAATALLKDRKMGSLIDKVYHLCKTQENLPKESIVNHVKQIYEPFTDEDLSKKMVELLVSDNINAEVELVYQTVAGLHSACPIHNGDWYFTGNYPTPGGNMAVNKAFISYYEGKERD